MWHHHFLQVQTYYRLVTYGDGFQTYTGRTLSLISILILLDLSAAFDTVSYSILLTRISELIGLRGSALSWFPSYLFNRKQYVTLKDAKSTLAPVNHGSVSTVMLMTLNYTSAPNPPLSSRLVHSSTVCKN